MITKRKKTWEHLVRSRYFVSRKGSKFRFFWDRIFLGLFHQLCNTAYRYLTLHVTSFSNSSLWKTIFTKALTVDPDIFKRQIRNSSSSSSNKFGLIVGHQIWYFHYFTNWIKTQMRVNFRKKRILIDLNETQREPNAELVEFIQVFLGWLWWLP